MEYREIKMAFNQYERTREIRPEPSGVSQTPFCQWLRPSIPSFTSVQPSSISGRSFDRQPWEKLENYPIPTWMPTGKSGDPQSTVLLTHWSQPNFSQLYATQQNPSVHSYSSTPTIVKPKPKYLIPHPQFPVERWSSGESTPDIQLLDVENNTQNGTISVHHSAQ